MTPATSRSPGTNPRGPRKSTTARRIVPFVVLPIFLIVAGWAFFTNENLAQSAIPSISGSNWWWVALGIVGVAASFVCAAAVLIGLATTHLTWHVAIIAQWAAAGSKVVTPASSGVLGVNTRLLVQHGVKLGTAVTTVGATQVAQLGLTVVLVALFAPAVGVRPRFSLPPASSAWIIAALAVAGIGAAIGYWQYRKRPRTPGGLTMEQRFGTALRSALATAQSPRRLMLVVGGSIGLTFSLAVCMWSMVQAVGGHCTFLVAAFVMMVGAGLGNFVPTPGGVGGVEASMVAVFLATGQSSEVALQAVLMFRLLSFWLPAPLGALAAYWLHRHHHL